MSKSLSKVIRKTPKCTTNCRNCYRLRGFAPCRHLPKYFKLPESRVHLTSSLSLSNPHPEADRLEQPAAASMYQGREQAAQIRLSAISSTQSENRLRTSQASRPRGGGGHAQVGSCAASDIARECLRLSKAVRGVLRIRLGHHPIWLASHIVIPCPFNVIIFAFPHRRWSSAVCDAGSTVPSLCA